MNKDLEIQREAIIEIVGTQYEGRAENHYGLKEQQKLIIRHQPDNAHDSNAVEILTEDEKMLGFIPKGYASIYAPAIDSGRYTFSAEVVKTEQDAYRPILIIKVTAEYISRSEEETEKSIIELVKDIVDGFAGAKEEYQSFIYSDTVDTGSLTVSLNNARLMYKLFQCSSDLLISIIKENYIKENSSSSKTVSAESLKKSFCDLQADVRNTLKKIQKEYNEAYELEIDNEDEYLRVQTEMRERRKKFRAYDGMLKATPHNHRLTPLYIIRLHIFRHITQILLALRQQGGVEFGQSDEKSDCASDAQWLCGVALMHFQKLSMLILLSATVCVRTAIASGQRARIIIQRSANQQNKYRAQNLKCRLYQIRMKEVRKLSLPLRNLIFRVPSIIGLNLKGQMIFRKKRDHPDCLSGSMRTFRNRKPQII